MDDLTAINLIEDAMAGVRIVKCEHCNGVGETLCGPCEECDGWGNAVTGGRETCTT